MVRLQAGEWSAQSGLEAGEPRLGGGEPWRGFEMGRAAVLAED